MKWGRDRTFEEFYFERKLPTVASSTFHNIYFRFVFPFYKHLKTDSHDKHSLRLITSPSWWIIAHTHKLTEFPLRMYLVEVRERYPVRCVRCGVTCPRLLLQDGKYAEAVFPLPQQRKSLNRTHLLFCPSRTVTDTLRVGSQTNTTCSTRPRDIPPILCFCALYGPGNCCG